MAGRSVLLVHGAWHGSWCWDDWSAVLAEAGHRPRAIDLPGHDAPGSRHRIWTRIGGYVAAVGQELDRLGTEAVVIGHSMGGLVTQRVLEQRSAALGILVASVPRSGVWGATVRTARAIPLPFAKANATVSMWPIVGTPALTRRAFFTPDTPAEVVDACHDRLQDESYLAYLQMLAVLPRPSRVRTPVRVLAAGEDRIFTVAEERSLAVAYGTDAVVVDGAGHDLMLDPAGRPALDRVLAWLAELG
ncbi:alpha/beta hydrolase [Euzebya sp.]|uniref:alpha/beta hydrolase n=1 Tax=Euzebya sp. TaxID=1971409 RepID=UPI003512F338